MLKTIGWHRKVQVYDKLVVKTARNKVSVYCNKLEAELSGSSPYLAKVISTSYDFETLVMVKVEIPSFRKRLQYAKFLKKELKSISDVHWYNIGEIDGKPMLYDYGGTLVTWRLLYRRLKNASAN